MSKVDTQYGEAIFKQTQEVAEMFRAMMPKVTTNMNAFEIRTKVLEIAQLQAWQDYHASIAGYETSVTKDGDEVVTTIKMPQVPGADVVLAAAEKFYNFVSQSPKK